MIRKPSALTLVAGTALGLAAAPLWRQVAPAPVQAQSGQAAPVVAAFALNADEWVVVNERGESAVYSKDGTIVRRCVTRPTGAREIDCRNPY